MSFMKDAMWRPDLCVKSVHSNLRVGDIRFWPCSNSPQGLWSRGLCRLNLYIKALMSFRCSIFSMFWLQNVDSQPKITKKIIHSFWLENNNECNGAKPVGKPPNINLQGISSLLVPLLPVHHDQPTRKTMETQQNSSKPIVSSRLVFSSLLSHQTCIHVHRSMLWWWVSSTVEEWLALPCPTLSRTTTKRSVSG